MTGLCEACRTNDNYRFAYGCSGPCDNASAEELVESVAGVKAIRSAQPPVHEHRFCACPPGYCSKTCLECRAHADSVELGAVEVAAW
ncbi:MAG: hypothetical protein WC876_04440 [Candidatus Thermoplasmatota archaeon]|jgi:hypothetical protein